MTEKKRDVYGNTEGRQYSELPDILLPTEVCEFFRVTRPQLAKWLKAGEFPNAYKSGSAWRIPKKDVYDLTLRFYGTGTKKAGEDDQS